MREQIVREENIDCNFRVRPSRSRVQEGALRWL